MSKAGFSIADLQQGAKKLNTVESPAADAKDAKAAAPTEVDRETTIALVRLYEKHDGDLDRIFNELRADPSKANKPHHRPKNAEEFATNYLKGFYSVIDSDQDTAADSKSSHK